jgi:HKD family nuclease
MSNVADGSSFVARKLTHEFNEIKEQILEAYISVGMISGPILDFFLRATTRSKKISIITGIHMPTPPEIFKKLKKRVEAGQLTAGVVVDNFFHPKLYLFKLSETWVGYVGSGNFTNGGWFANDELFIKVTDQKTCEDLFKKHEEWVKKAKQIDQTFLLYYEGTYATKNANNVSNRKETQDFVDRLNGNFNIDIIDFNGQFFDRQDHSTFQPGKTHLDIPEILLERQRVRQKLLRLNDLVVDQLPLPWDIHPHYETEHIVAGIYTQNHHDYNVRGLWTGFGRSKEALKKYGEINTTPLYNMRMQIIIEYDFIGNWLMPGKSGGGQIDREYFNKQIKENRNSYVQQFFNELTSLGESFWIEVANIKKDVKSFLNSEELREYILADNWREYYFTIGRDYKLGSTELLTENIVSTVISDFEKFYPLYEMIREKSME